MSLNKNTFLIQKYLGNIPKHWTHSVLGDLCAKIFDGSHKTPKYEDSGVPFLRVSDLQNKEIDLTRTKYISLDEHKLFTAHNKTEMGDILVSKNGTIGLTRIVDWGWEFSTFVSLATIKLRRNENKLDPHFLCYLIASPILETQIKNQSKQGTVTNLHLEEIQKFLVPLPPIWEQRKITAILRTWDDAIEKVDKILSIKEREKAALAQRLLTGKLRARGSKSTWKAVKLHQVTTEIKARNTNNKLGIEKVMGVNKVHGIIPMREETIGAKIDRYKIVPPRTFAYNPMRINIGSLAMCDKDEPVLVSPDYVVFSCNEESLDPLYFNQFRRSHIWEKYMEAAGNGSVRIRIYYNDLGDLKIKLPPIDEQKRIAAVLACCDKEISKLKDLAEAYKTQKRGLMQKLLTGEWRVKTTDKEAA